MIHLFQRDPEDLGDYKPKFSREEVMLGYTVTKVQIGGGLGWMEDEVSFVDRQSITVLGLTLEHDGHLYLPPFHVVVEIVNHFLADNSNKTRHPEQWKWLTDNAHDLNLSRRYWETVDQFKRIDDLDAKIDALKKERRKARHVASMMAVEVKAERSLSKEEKRLLLAEFSGDEFGAEND